MTAAIQYFSPNTAGRDFMVGDIHGCFYLLEALLERLDFERRRDRLFSVGDLIDRGPDSERATDYLAEPWFHAIRGNHEQMLLDASTPGPAQRDNRGLWQLNGGDWFDGLDTASRDTLIEHCAALPLAMEIELAGGYRAGLVHADVLDDSWPVTRERLEDAGDSATAAGERTLVDLVWGRERAHGVLAGLEGRRPRAPIAVDGIDVVMFGHTPMLAPIAAANTRWLDTGAVFGGRLAIAELALAGTVWSLEAGGERVHEGWRHLAT